MLTGELAFTLFHDVVHRHLRRRHGVIVLVRRTCRACVEHVHEGRGLGGVSEADVRFGGDQIDFAEAVDHLDLAALLRR